MAGTTADCGRHCKAPGKITQEYHCPRSCCHGRPTAGYGTERQKAKIWKKAEKKEEQRKERERKNKK